MTNLVPVEVLTASQSTLLTPHLPADAPLAVRKAGMHDIPALLHIINNYARQGIMLPRTEFEMAENIRDFVVIPVDDALAGCAALHFFGPSMGEIRSLAVEPSVSRKGLGRILVENLISEARNFGLSGVFAFTYVVPFFQKLGFREVERGELPLKAWKDCLRCPKFQCCDEIAMYFPLR
jgi:amino-acid N-acetyltransferase